MFIRILLALLAAFAGVVATSAASAQALGPDDLVKKVTQEVFDAIGRDKALQAGDRTRAIALAEEKVLPHIDFEEMTKLAAGRAWRMATPEQRDALVREFRTLLIRTYSSMIGAYRGQTLEVDGARMAPGAMEATVRNRYLRSGAPPTPVDYAMRKTEGGWKIYDIVVEGISLVATYRSTFEEALRRGGVDGLIAQLADKNRTFAAPR